MSKSTVVPKTQMDSFAQTLTTSLHGGDVVLLSGELGAGKTTLTKGIARALGLSNTITSPTFTLMNIYSVNTHPTIKTLAHIDTYRLETLDELRTIGVQEYVGRNDVLTIVEWPEKLTEFFAQKNIPLPYREIHIEGTGDERKITSQ